MRVAFVGWRGMVGSVLMERMRAEHDFDGLEPTFFSTSNPGGTPPDVGADAPPLGDAFDLDALASHEVVLTCQGGDYTRQVHPALRAAGWKGHWIDAASALRMDDDAVIVLDPINRAAIDRALADGGRDWIGGNCTVSLMLLAFGGLFRKGWVRWMSTMTYQAASGAGARQLTELVAQMRDLGTHVGGALDADRPNAIDIERAVTARLRSADHPTDAVGHPLAANLLPWIDTKRDDGRSREEWKGAVESAKILGGDPAVPVDGLCVRIGALRCHAQAVTVGLTARVPLDAVEAAIAETSAWTRVVPNDPEASWRDLTPAAVTGTLAIPVGRLRYLTTDPTHLTAFTVGDQLLWGAAEPLRRMLAILRGRL